MKDCETNDCRKEKRGCKGCYYENKKIPSTDKTYCYGMFCKEYEKCERYVGHYNFEKDTNYWFMYMCEEKKKEVEKDEK